jgi:hypothetical protein
MEFSREDTGTILYEAVPVRTTLLLVQVIGTGYFHLCVRQSRGPTAHKIESRRTLREPEYVNGGNSIFAKEFFVYL